MWVSEFISYQDEVANSLETRNKANIYNKKLGAVDSDEDDEDHEDHEDYEDYEDDNEDKDNKDDEGDEEALVNVLMHDLVSPSDFYNLSNYQNSVSGDLRNAGTRHL